jgi:hypothetical protein
MPLRTGTIRGPPMAVKKSLMKPASAVGFLRHLIVAPFTGEITEVSIVRGNY